MAEHDTEQDDNPPQLSPSEREVEAKFILLDAAIAAQWRNATGFVPGFRLGAAIVVREIDAYFDTAEFGLLRRGYTLRLRNRTRDDGVQQIAGYKSIDFHTPRGVHSRIEVEETLAEPLPLDARMPLDSLPARIAEPLGAVLRTRDNDDPATHWLLPIVQVRQKRHKMDVSTKPAITSNRGRKVANPPEPLGELSIDALRIFEPIVSRKGLVEEWREVAESCIVEVEIRDDSQRDDLRTLASQLRELEGVKASDLGKLQSALYAVAERRMYAHSDEATRAHTAEFCRAIWSGQLAVMLNNEAGVRFSEDIEYVHEMRVATRRARAAMRLYAGFFDAKNRGVKRFARALRTTGRLLGRVRDLDVALERLQRFADERSESKTSSGKPSANKRKRAKSLEQRISHMTDERSRALAELVTWFDSEQYARFIRRFSRFCASPGKGVPIVQNVAGKAPRPVQLRHTLPSMIWSRFEAVRAFEPLFEGAASGEGVIPVETLHALRIECKYLRYHLEFAAPLLGDEGDSLIATIKVLQEELGALNDAVVGGKVIFAPSLGAAQTPTTGRRAAATEDTDLAQWQAEQEATIERMQNTIPGGFASFVGVENRQRLAAALARL